MKSEPVEKSGRSESQGPVETRKNVARRPDGMPVGRPFVKGGAPGPGRPRGYDFKTIVESYVQRNKSTVEESVEEVFKALMVAAKAGDVNAAKLVIERLCGKDPDKLELSGGVDVQVVTGVPE